MDQPSAMYLPGAASLADLLDCRISVLLQDGRYLVGCLRSYDQYLNLVLHKTFERMVYQGFYSETDIGVYVVRGENIVLFGEVDSASTLQLLRVSPQELHEKIREGGTSRQRAEWELE